MESPQKTRAAVIAATLELLADEGYAGASLRKVAARAGIAQPSLYHYFDTKEDLVETVLGTYAGQMYGAADPDALPKTLDALPRFVAETTMRLWNRPTHAQFVRAAFSVARVNPRFGALLRGVFVERAAVGMRLLVQPFVARGEIDGDDATFLARLLVNAIALKMIEERVLTDGPDRPDLDDYLAFVVRAGELLVASLRR
jgi:AcrR family transcriptional regulator